MNKLNPIFHIQKLIQNAMVQTLHQEHCKTEWRAGKKPSQGSVSTANTETTFESIKAYTEVSETTCSSNLSRSWGVEDGTSRGFSVWPTRLHRELQIQKLGWTITVTSSQRLASTYRCTGGPTSTHTHIRNRHIHTHLHHTQVKIEVKIIVT